MILFISLPDSFSLRSLLAQISQTRSSLLQLSTHTVDKDQEEIHTSDMVATGAAQVTVKTKDRALSLRRERAQAARITFMWDARQSHQSRLKICQFTVHRKTKYKYP